MAEAIALSLIASGSAAAASAGAVILGNVALVNAALTIGASLAYGSVQSRSARRQARDQFNASLKDREVMVRGGTAPQRIIYGRDRISGPIIYVQSTGTKKEFLHLVVALAGHECDAIESIYFNDVLLPTPDGSGNITSGDFAYTTTASTTETALVANGSGIVTLAAAASRVTAAFREYGVGIEAAYTPASYTHTPGASTVSGLTAGASYSVAYETTTATPLVRIKKYLGTAAQTADADLVAESGGTWTSAHRGRGICYLYVRLKYHQDVFGQVGIPNISCVVKGKKVYDPRSATTVWSDNAALCQADFLRDATYGLAATSAQVPDSEIITAANLCDETVNITISTTQKRYTFNGSFTSEVSPMDVLRAMTAATAGAVVWTQGRWYVRPGAYRSPSVTLNEDTLADGSLVTAVATSRAELFNAVRVTYRDPARDYAEVQAPLVSNATYQTQDGGRQIVRDLKLQFSCDSMRAQRLGKIELERSRQPITLRMRNNLKAYDLAPTDTAGVTLARYGWSGKPFEVVERTWAGGVLEHTLRETASGVYDWAYGEATTVDLAPNTTLPNPYAKPDTLAGLAVTSDAGMAVSLGSGAATLRAYVTWTQSSDQFVVQGGRIEVEWKRARDTEWIRDRVPGDATSAWVAGVPNNNGILVRVRPVTPMGRAGEWTYASHTVNGIGSLPSLGAMLETFSNGYGLWRNYEPGAELSIIDISDGEFGGHALRIGNNSGNDEAWLIHEANIAYEPGALYRMRIRVRRTAGAGQLYAGVAGVAADGVTFVNYSGADAYGSQNWICASAATPGSSFEIFDGYFTGTAATGSTTAHPDPYSPGTVHTNTRYVRPILLLNYTEQTGTFEVDYVVIDKVKATGDLAPNAASEGDIVDSSTVTGSSGSPGASVRVATVWGPTITTEAGDQLDLKVSGVLVDTFWSQPAIASVELWLTHAPTFGGTQTEFGTRRKFQSPVDVFTSSSYFSLDMNGQIEPGAVTQDYVLRVSITYRDAAGVAKTCGKDFTADAQWRVVRRKR
jgi:hypothetical protein